MIMKKENQNEMFKKEFSDEIDKTKVTIEDLKKHKVPVSVLEAEVILGRAFGDEIYIPKRTNDAVEGEKEIVKLTESDIAFDSQVRELCENLEDSEFDSNVSSILSKIDYGED